MFRHAVCCLNQSRVLSLAACSALAMLLLFFRVGFSRQPIYLFLAWNLTLAWIPYLCSLGTTYFRPERGRTAVMATLVIVWLLFFPNAPYLMTDFVHLRARAPLPYWYDIALVTSFAWTGTMLGLVSLQLMHRRIQARLGTTAGWSVVVVASGLAGAGIYIGRFLRWNSWDLVLRTEDVVADSATRFLHPFGFPSAWGVTLVFGALLLALYSTFVSGTSGLLRAGR